MYEVEYSKCVPLISLNPYLMLLKHATSSEQFMATNLLPPVSPQEKISPISSFWTTSDWLCKDNFLSRREQRQRKLRADDFFFLSCSSLRNRSSFLLALRMWKKIKGRYDPYPQEYQEEPEAIAFLKLLLVPWNRRTWDIKERVTKRLFSDYFLLNFNRTNW